MWDFKVRKIVFLGLFCLALSCSAQKRTKFEDASQHGLNVYLWRTTNKIWTNSFENRVIELVERGAEIDFNAPYGNIEPTPFLNASGMIERLKDSDRHTHSQIDSMELEAVKIVKYLAKKGANVHAVDISKRNGLHLAAQGGREKMIPVLVDLGLDINAKDSTFWRSTPLILAITAGDLATVKALVERGADINQCSAYGNTPLDWAIIRSKTKSPESYPYQDEKEIAEYLKSLGAKTGKADFQGWVF